MWFRGAADRMSLPKVRFTSNPPTPNCSVEMSDRAAEEKLLKEEIWAQVLMGLRVNLLLGSFRWFNCRSVRFTGVSDVFIKAFQRLHAFNDASMSKLRVNASL